MSDPVLNDVAATERHPLEAEASAYATEIAECLGGLMAAVEASDLVAARSASRRVKQLADALQLLLATGKPLR
jgi:hypothetical protein